MAEIISIANQKGGVGKTTTAINLAYSLAFLNNEVLVIDIDPQGNASSGLGVSLNENEPSIYEYIIDKSDFQDVIRYTNNELLDIIPANRDLAGAEIELTSMENREFVLKRKLDAIKHMYDFIIIDCPPSLSFLTVNALTASDSVINPVQCEYLSMEGLAHFIKTAGKIKQSLNPGLELDGGIITMFDNRMNLSNQVRDEISKFYQHKMYQTPVPRNVKLAEAPSYGQSIFNYDANCKGAKAYFDLSLEFLSRRGIGDISQYLNYSVQSKDIKGE